MKFTLLVLLGFTFFIANSQVSIEPKITGDTILCPNKSGELTTTEPYDSYQWYFHGYNDTVWKPFGNGGEQRTISITDKHVLNYFKVEVTESGFVEESRAVLIDQYAFLPPTVQTTGDFSVGNNGEAQYCAGDSMYFVLNAPYDTSITWFRNSSIIPNETDDTLLVKESGYYTVSGAPSICPDYVLQLGVTLEVIRFDPNEPILTQSNDSLIVTNKDSFQSFTWYRNGSEILTNLDYYYLPDSIGEFYVRTTDLNGCSSISDTINFQPSGIENPVSLNIDIFPNPATDKLLISMKDGDQATLRIFNMEGKVLNQYRINSEAQIDVSNYSNGIYLAEIYRQGDVIRKKIMIH